MKPILILLSPAFGHYHATYKIATQLRERGYQVIYAGEGAYKESVVSLGFEFLEFSFGDLVRDRYGKARYLDLNVIRYFFFNLFNRRTGRTYEQYAEVSREAKKVIAAVKPALILIDIHISTLYLLLVQTGVPCIQICTTLSTNYAKAVPPINSGFIPSQTFVSKCVTAVLWARRCSQDKIDYLFQKIIYNGRDNDSFLRRFAMENNVRPGRFVRNRNLITGQIPLPELVFAPKLFDYPWRTEQSNVTYIGPSVLLERTEVCHDTLSTLLEKLKIAKGVNRSFRIVYCSLGTINYWQNKNCLQFFKKVIAAFENKLDWFVIMVIGKDVPREHLGGISDNINIFDVVPQIKVLSVADVMITHGGFNTTKECILSGVPMVVYPLSDLWDQEGNAARIVYHKIGLRGKLEDDTSQMIFSKVNRLFSESEFKTNIRDMRDSFSQLNDSTAGIDKIESFIRERNCF